MSKEARVAARANTAKYKTSPWRPRFVKYDLSFLQNAAPKQGNRIALSAKFDKRHVDWIRRHWEYVRWQRYNHPPKSGSLNRYNISHGFVYFHPLLYSGYFTKNKNLTKTFIRYRPLKRRFQLKHPGRYQEPR